MIRLIIIAAAITPPKNKLSNQRYTMDAITADHMTPFSKPMADSFKISSFEFEEPI